MIAIDGTCPGRGDVRGEFSRAPNGRAGRAGYRCSCGFGAGDLELFEDHLFTFPEDDHYELARDQESTP
jgi:hypothetical protein